MPKEVSEVNNISINKTIKEVLRPKLSQKTNIVWSLEEFDYISPDTITRDKP